MLLILLALRLHVANTQLAVLVSAVLSRMCQGQNPHSRTHTHISTIGVGRDAHSFRWECSIYDRILLREPLQSLGHMERQIAPTPKKVLTALRLWMDNIHFAPVGVDEAL